MYYFLADLLQPYTVLFLAALVGLVIVWRRHSESRRRLLPLVVPVVCLALISLPAVSFLAVGSLEWQFPASPEAESEAAPLVVLSGWAHRPQVPEGRAFLGTDSQFRCRHAAMLYRQGPRSTVIVCGGLLDPEDLGGPLADLMRDHLIELGVAPEDIVTESNSRSTFENAPLASPLLRERGIRRIRLVTDGLHLTRATRCFLAQGFEVIPAASSYQATKFNWSLLTFVPNAKAAVTFEAAAHEWVGMIVYWMQGYFRLQESAPVAVEPA
jgi:uncharacterized SAM-binding protein YcdF (DUF218 family)